MIVKRGNIIILFCILLSGLLAGGNSNVGILTKDKNIVGREIISVGETGCDETTIQDAFDNHNLEPGDIIEIRDSRTYSENVDWGSDDYGSPDNRVILRAQYGQNPIIEGRVWIPSSVNYVQLGGEESNGRITVDPTTESWVDGAINVHGSHNIIQYMIVQDVYDGNGIFLWGGGTNNIIQYNILNDIGTSRFVFPGSQGDAIIVYENQTNAHHLIQDNYIGNAAHTGIITYSGCSFIQIINNTVDNPYGNGIGAQTSSFILVDGNIIYGTGTAQNWTNKRSLQLTGSDHCTVRRNIVYNAYNEAMEANSYSSNQIQDHIFVYNNVFHTTGWAGIVFGSWVSGCYTTNTPVINNIFFNIALRGDQMFNPSKNAVTHVYGGTCNPEDDLGDSDAELQANNLKDSNFQNNCVIINNQGSMPRYALQYWNTDNTYNLMGNVSEINAFDESTTGNIDGDPLFANDPPNENWWYLQQNSPCIDSGIVVYDSNAAIGGWDQLTYSGSAPDIGAYEYEQGGVEEESSFHVYPNPCEVFRRNNFIAFENLSPGVIIKIYDITGRCVNDSGNLLTPFYRWYVTNVSSGVYFYTINLTVNNKVVKGKIVVIR